MTARGFSQFTLQQLVRNTTINFASFGIVGVLGLLTVAWLIAAYGLTEYGLIVLARYLLPSGLLGALDFGLSEAATRLVARAEANKARAELSEIITLSLLAALALGAVFGIGFMAASGWISRDLFRLPGPQGVDFEGVIFWTGIGIIVLLPAQATEAVLKGLNLFAVIRVADVALAVAYTVAVFWLIRAQAPYFAVAYAYVLLAACRGLVLFGWIAAFARPGRRWSPCRFGQGAVAKLAETAWPMFLSKSIAIGLMYLPPMAIGRLAGPAGVGVFDVLARIPRIIKVIIGVAMSALLPTAAAIDSRGRTERLAMVSRSGSVLLMFLFAPPIVASALYAGEIMGVWLGPEFSRLAPWFALFLVWPAVLCVYQTSNTALGARLRALRRLSWLNGGQLFLTLVLGLALFGRIQEYSFVVAIVVAEVAALPVRLSIVAGELGDRLALYWLGIARIFLPILVLAVPFIVIQLYRAPIHAAVAAIFYVSLCALSWWALYRFTLAAEERAELARILAYATRALPNGESASSRKG